MITTKELKKQSSENKNYLFNQIINNKYKLVPFNTRINDVGNTKYLPASSKEWKNSIYYYNNNNIKNFPVYDININTLIKSYFNMCFDYRFTFNKFRSRRTQRLSLNRIHISKSETKHTNSKAIITIYAFNKEKISLLKKINKIRRLFLKRIYLLYSKTRRIYKGLDENTYNQFVESILIKELLVLRRYKLRLNLNKYKFEELFLYKLSKLISKLYNKKVEFNIVNLKSIILNSDLFTEILTLKIKKKKANVIRRMNYILNKARLPKVNNIQERGSVVKSVDFNLLENKYKNLNLYSVLGLAENSIEEILSDLYYVKNTSQLKNRIFNSIKYKNMGGIRLEVKGRLTRRYRADRAIYKVKWKGGLKNIDSSFKGLSSVNKRGYLNSNVEYSMFTSKRRIGAFGVKGWISGK